jgi:hypothetical protein
MQQIRFRWPRGIRPQAASGQAGFAIPMPGRAFPYRGAERRNRRKPAAVVMRELIGTGLGSKAALPCHRVCM